MNRLERATWVVGCLTAAILATCLGLLLASGQGTLFSPGPLSAEQAQTTPIAGVTSHADFENKCDRCHTPFRGPDSTLCVRCHKDVGDQIGADQGIHAGLAIVLLCAWCHPDHKGRAASLTRASISELPHNQYGFTLANHEIDYDGRQLLCRSCHPSDNTPQTDKLSVIKACVDCHARADLAFVIDHRKQAGDACVACHDGTDRLRGFSHDNTYRLTGKHALVSCNRCHLSDRYKGTPGDCVQCHPDAQTHKGQLGTGCSACHTTAGWRPARLIKHNFPIAHGNKGKDATCQTCHPANYGTYTCYVCHDHNEADIKNEHIGWSKWDEECMRCHPTGKRIE